MEHRSSIAAQQELTADRFPVGAKRMDVKAKKHALRLIPYGLYVLTARTDDAGDLGPGVNAATISWVSQASFEPPRIVVALRNDSGIWHRARAAGAFVINVVGTGQKALAASFFRHVEPEGNRLDGLAFHQGVTGAPILDDVPAYLECRVVQTLDAGGHTLFLADIVEAGVQNDLGALDLAETGWYYGG
jgi:flavin reductase (DIM6/NTAB) family NADH-FMN oxidoreductase RutF